MIEVRSYYGIDIWTMTPGRPGIISHRIPGIEDVKLEE
jgi:hypothetical protein